jgi:hypothetical protein
VQILSLQYPLLGYVVSCETVDFMKRVQVSQRGLDDTYPGYRQKSMTLGETRGSVVQVECQLVRLVIWDRTPSLSFWCHSSIGRALG